MDDCAWKRLSEGARRRIRPSFTVLVPLDRSELAKRALPFAAALVRRAGGRLVLAQATSMPSSHQPDLGAAEPLLRAGEEHASAELEEAGAALREEQVPVETRVCARAPELAIPEAIADTGARLVVMASHGRTGPARWLLGSVTEQVLCRCDAPVVVVPDGYTRSWSVAEALRILVALDGGDLAEEVLAPVCELAALVGGELVLVRVVAPQHEIESYAFPVGDAAPGPVPAASAEMPLLVARVDEAETYLADVADRLRGLVPTVRTRVEVGGVEDELAGAAVATGAHLIAMVTHRRGELTRLLLGSHAIATLRRADVPVMMVRPAAQRAAEPAPEDGDAVPRGPVTIEIDADELDLIRCGLNRLLDDPAAGSELERSVFALENRLSAAVKGAQSRVTVG